MSDAQAKGPGSTSSQAQIGFKPYQKGEEKNDTQKIPYRGGGTASAQSGRYAGQSQTQIQGAYRYGVSYTGAAQASSGSKDGNVTSEGKEGGSFTPFKPIAVFTPFVDHKEAVSNINNTISDRFDSDSEPAVELTTFIPEELVQSGSRSSDPFPGYVPISSIESHTGDQGGTSTLQHGGSGSAFNSHVGQRTSSSQGAKQSKVVQGGGEGSTGYSTVVGDPQNSGRQGSNSFDQHPGSGKENSRSQPQFVPEEEEDTLEEEYDDDEDDDDDKQEEDGGLGANAFQQGNYGITNSRSQQGGFGLGQNQNAARSHNSGGSNQQQRVGTGSLGSQDAHVSQASDNGNKWTTGDVLESGSRIPGTPSYTIPSGFRGRVTSISGSPGTSAVAPQGSQSQSQTVSLSPGTGKVTYAGSREQHLRPVGYNGGYSSQRRSGTSGRQQSGYYNQQTGKAYRNSAHLRSGQNVRGPTPDSYVTVTQSVTGQLDNHGKVELEGKNYTHTYYSKSSTCGYFTFSCNVVFGSNGRTKICKPNPPTNPDGSPCCC